MHCEKCSAVPPKSTKDLKGNLYQEPTKMVMVGPRGPPTRASRMELTVFLVKFSWHAAFGWLVICSHFPTNSKQMDHGFP